ncbi:MAG: 50S ribosomal protein L11, partial [Candidatus Aenigmarchaeota archaeon]|nr:50S ribosomal protein L11 [Candidatus Aenigmarchaeota archaeon]
PAATETPVEKKVRVIVGDLTIDHCIKIMKMKRDSLLAKDTKKALKEIVASVVSMPLTVEGKNPKEILKEIDEGKYDDKLK